MSDPIAEQDQAITAMENLAVFISVYYQKLIGEGVSESTAAMLTLSYQTSLVAVLLKGPKNDRP